MVYERIEREGWKWIEFLACSGDVLCGSMEIELLTRRNCVMKHCVFSYSVCDGHGRPKELDSMPIVVEDKIIWNGEIREVREVREVREIHRSNSGIQIELRKDREFNRF